MISSRRLRFVGRARFCARVREGSAVVAARIGEVPKDIRLESDEALVTELLAVYRNTDTFDQAWIARELSADPVWLALALSIAAAAVDVQPVRRPTNVATELRRRTRARGRCS